MKTSFVGQPQTRHTSPVPKLRSTQPWILGSDRQIPLPDYSYVRPARTSRSTAFLRLIAEIQ